MINNQNKRERLINSAAELLHRQGLNATSLADIAKDADVPIGNVYYYFKTKEELALAALAKRKDQFTAVYAALNDAFDDPRQRLIEALGYFNKVREEYAKFGCPIGRVIEDARIEKDMVAKNAAQIFNDFVEWAEKQFQSLGHNENARMFATSLMSGIQGATIMAKAFSNPQIITDEIIRLTDWVMSLPNRKIHIGKVSVKAA